MKDEALAGISLKLVLSVSLKYGLLGRHAASDSESAPVQTCPVHDHDSLLLALARSPPSKPRVNEVILNRHTKGQ